MKKKSKILEELKINTDHLWLGEPHPIVDAAKEVAPPDKEVVVEIRNGMVWLSMQDKSKS